MKRVISYAFFRHSASAYESPRCGEAQGKFFVNYIRAIVRGHHAVFPDWEMWIHHDDRVTQYPYWKAMERMAERGLFRLLYVGKAETLCGSMLWRMIPVWNLDVSLVLCRDVDSFPTPRERKAIGRWIESEKPVSALHDSVSHSATALMGGMVGFDCEWMRERIPDWQTFVGRATRHGIDLNVHGADQLLLNAEVYPLAGQGQLVASEDKESLGPKEHPIDFLISHTGGAFHVQPVVDWFNEHPEYCPVLDAIKECEAA